MPIGPARPSTWPIILVMGTAAAYTAYSAYHEVGLAGWLNHAQQALFGGYMAKLSVILTF